MIGHNPKASQNQPEDLQAVAALLRSLPQVSAPADFNARLQARLASAKVETREFADITSLVKELPRVAAPADFNFKVRARIAQAKAKQEKSSAGWLAGLFGRSFSLAQASAAMAVVAVIVSAVAFGVLQSGNSVRPTDTLVVVTKPMVPTNPNTDTPAPHSRAVENMQQVPVPTAIRNPISEPSRNKAPRTLHSPTPNDRESVGTIAISSPEVPSAIATRTVIIKHRSGEARMVNLSEYNLGLQSASLRSTPATVVPSKEAAFASNIY